MYITSQRLKMIDAMRGFSLLGIILANMFIFQYGVWGLIDVQMASFSTADRILKQLLELFVVGSAMPIFAFLYGFGMIKMKDSLEKRQLSPYTHLSRRFAMIMLIGMVHAFFIWEGDILTYYGIYGFLLLLYIRCRPRTLLIWTVIGFTLLLLLTLLTSFIPEPAMTAAERTYHLQTLSAYSQGSYLDTLIHRNTTTLLGSFPFSFVLMFFFSFFTSLLYMPMFLLGMYMAKTHFFESSAGEFDSNEKNQRKKYMKAMLLFLPIGFIIKSLPILLSGTQWETLALLGGGPVLAIGYIFAFAWLYTLVGKASWMNNFAAVGKLSLTNYLLQSLICTTLFYGYGFGWFGQLGIVMGTVIALIIYALQWFGSSWYLRRYTYGPVEKLLRMWTNLSSSGQPKTRQQTVE